MKISDLLETAERSVLSVMGRQLEKVPSDFRCSDDALTSLEGSPQSVGYNFICHKNNLESLDGAPAFVGGSVWAWGNKLTSLHNIHKIFKHIGDDADFDQNPITSHVLGLLMIDGLQTCELENKVVRDIMRKHLAGDKDIFACQEELIEAGFTEFAKI